MDKIIVSSLQGMEVNVIKNQSKLSDYSKWGAVYINELNDYISIDRGTATSGWGIVTSEEETMFGNTTYTIEFDYMTNDLTKLSYCYIISKASGNQSVPAIDLISDGKWHSISINIVPTQDRYRAGILLGADYRNTSGNNFNVKNFRVYQTYLRPTETREAKEILVYKQGKWQKARGNIHSKSDVKRFVNFNRLSDDMAKLGITNYRAVKGAVEDGFQLNTRPLKPGNYVLSDNDIEENITVVGTNIQPDTSDEWRSRTFKGWQSYFERISIDPSKGFITGSGYINPQDHPGRLMFTFWLNSGGYTQSVSNVIEAGDSGYATVTARIPDNCAEVSFALRHMAGTTPDNLFRYKEIKVEYGSEKTKWCPIGDINKVSTTGIKGHFGSASVITKSSLDNSNGYYIEFLRPMIQLLDNIQDVEGMYIFSDTTLRNNDGIRFNSDYTITVS